MKISIQKEELDKQMAEMKNLKNFSRDVYTAFRVSLDKCMDQQIGHTHYQDLYDSLIFELDRIITTYKIKPRP